MFFDARRYDLAKVGRYKFNKKLALRNRINGHVIAEDVLDPSTGEVIAEAGTTATRELADQIQNAAVPFVWIQTESRNVKVLSSMMVDLQAWIPEIEDPIGKRSCLKLSFSWFVLVSILKNRLTKRAKAIPRNVEKSWVPGLR